MSKALAKVEAALQADQDRVTRRESFAKSVSAVNGAVPAAWNDPAPFEKKTISQVGNRVQHALKFWKRHGKPSALHSQDRALRKLQANYETQLDNFVSKLLTSPSLMARSSKMMRSIFAQLFGDGDAVVPQLGKGAFLHQIAQLVHDLKVATAKICYLDHVQPRFETESRLTAINQSLRSKFKEARTMYLKEVSMFRDEQRARPDPLADIILFYEPLKTLEGEERETVIGVVREVLKVIFEKKPSMAKDFDNAKLLQMLHESENVELKKATETVREKSEEIARLTEFVEHLEQELTNASKPAAETADSKVSQAVSEKQILVLQEQLDDVRTSFYEEQRRATRLEKERETLLLERKELQHALHNENFQKAVLQEDIQRVVEDQRAMRDQVATMRGDNVRMTEVIKEKHVQVNRLQRIIKRLRFAKAVPRGDRIHGVPGDAETYDEDYDEEVERICAEGLSGEADPVGLKELLEESEASERKTAAQLEQALARIADLEVLLKAHAEDLSIRQGQGANLKEPEVEDLTKLAECLGCDTETPAESIPRVCACSNILMHDANFCRRCGAKWSNEQMKTELLDLGFFASVIARIDSKILQARKRLQAAGGGLQASGGGVVNQAPSSCEPASEPAPLKDAELEMKQLRNEIRVLEAQKTQAEAQLLLERIKGVMPRPQSTFPGDGGDEDGCDGAGCDGASCPHKQRLDVYVSYFDSIQALGGQALKKLLKGMDENSRLRGIVRDLRGSMDYAVSVCDAEIQDARRAVQDAQDAHQASSPSMNDGKRSGAGTEPQAELEPQENAESKELDEPSLIRAELRKCCEHRERSLIKVKRSLNSVQEDPAFWPGSNAHSSAKESSGQALLLERTLKELRKEHTNQQLAPSFLPSRPESARNEHLARTIQTLDVDMADKASRHDVFAAAPSGTSHGGKLVAKPAFVSPALGSSSGPWELTMAGHRVTSVPEASHLHLGGSGATSVLEASHLSTPQFLTPASIPSPKRGPNSASPSLEVTSSRSVTPTHNARTTALPPTARPSSQTQVASSLSTSPPPTTKIWPPSTARPSTSTGRSVRKGQFDPLQAGKMHR